MVSDDGQLVDDTTGSKFGRGRFSPTNGVDFMILKQDEGI